MTTGAYIIITPARDEEQNIEKTLEAMVAQTVLPRRWIIVSDGSTDRTDEFVARYAQRNRFIELVRAGESGERNFGSKVNAFNAGYERLKSEEYDFVGNIDADVSFEPDYFKKLLGEFKRDEKLGLAGGQISELINGEFHPQDISLNSVAGAVQLFRRETFESIGGYVPLKLGGIDAIAETKVRMAGWKVRTFVGLPVWHHGLVITGKRNIYSTRFYHGVTRYILGYHPLFQMFSCLRRLRQRPRLIGSVLVMVGYCMAALSRRPKAVPDEMVRFLRDEQMERLGKLLRGVGSGMADKNVSSN